MWILCSHYSKRPQGAPNILPPSLIKLTLQNTSYQKNKGKSCGLVEELLLYTEGPKFNLWLYWLKVIRHIS